MIGISKIQIKNFKSLQSVTIDDCKKINLFIGYPNVGKSNLLEALSLYGVTGRSKKVSDFVRIDDNIQLFHNGNIAEPVLIDLNNKIRLIGRFSADSSIKFNFQFSGVGVNLEEIKDVNHFSYRNFVSNTGSFDILDHKDAFTNFSGDTHINSTPDINGSVNKIDIKPYSFKRNLIFGDGSAMQLESPNGENIFHILSSNKKLRTVVSDWFSEYELEFLFDRSDRSFKIQKRIDKDVFQIPYSMIADTLQRLLFYYVAIKSNEGNVLLFEEPEANMFIPYIGKIISAISSDNSNQFFITTHSPYIVEKLIEEERESLAVYFVGYKNGETEVKRMTESDIDEKMKYGIDLFFNVENYLGGEIDNA